jgi:peptidoglycan/xylan/chitin deacetylase (PgdA/CDA1 family)
MLLAAIGSHVAELVEVSRPKAADRRDEEPLTPPVKARLSPEDGLWRVDLVGPPHETVLVVVAGQPPIAVTLDRRGRARVEDLELPPGVSSVEVALLEHSPVTVEVEMTPTPTATASPSSTHTATPTAAASPTGSPTPTPSPMHSATPSAKPTAARRPPQTPTRTLSADELEVARSAPPVLHLVIDAGPRIAITFDGADSANRTTELLDLLRRLDLRVTLFVTGEFVEQNPGLVRRAALAGHEIANHTFSHRHLTSYADNRRHQLLGHVTREWLHDQLRRTEAAFQTATGRRMAPLWRAPFGEENDLIRGWAMELGYLHVRWSSLRGVSLDSLDWVDDEHSSLYRDSERMIQRLLEFPKLEGGIVLMHLASGRPEPPWNALPRFIERLDERGLEPVTVSELIEASATWRPWLERAAERHRQVFPPPTQ